MPARFAPATIIADTSGVFSDFGPYVPAVAPDGEVIFQARLRTGATGIFAGRGGPVETIASTASTPWVQSFDSHVAIDGGGSWYAYGSLPNGASALLTGERGGGPHPLVTIGERLAHIGPLGPTVNAAGRVAFRATFAGGREGVLTCRSGQAPLTMHEDGRCVRFSGLPLVNDRDQVAWRGELADGTQLIEVHDAGRTATWVTTGRDFAELAPVPSLSQAGQVIFAARRVDGTSGLFAAAHDRVEELVAARLGFESFRGGLVANGRLVCFYATPAGGTLGVYAADHPGPADFLVAAGRPFLGANVAELALNAVSVNEAGQVALRVALDGGPQRIVRFDLR